MPTPSPWLIRRVTPEAPWRLYCFSHAGGSAADYLPWYSALAPSIELCAVQLPGRGTRMAEPAQADLATVLHGIAQALAAADDDRPFAFFGHSLGALLAFEVTRLCRQRGQRLPAQLFVSACNAPACCTLQPPLHQLNDAQLLAHLQTYNGTPASLFANQELLGLVLPTLRADFTLVGNYTYAPQPPLPVPISVLAGRADPHVRADELAGWADETVAGCNQHWFDGDHFFIRPHVRAVHRCINAQLLAVDDEKLRRETTAWQ